jgi:putative hydrolase of the HAD superfamily
MDEKRAAPVIRAVVFDFGGVLAEEGFTIGLEKIGRDHGIDGEHARRVGESLVFSSGYVTGQVSEADFWEAFRRELGIEAEDRALRKTILEGFVLRPRMLALAEWLKKRGVRVAILSDQTDWLEALDRRNPFLYLFDPVYNSFRTGRTKRDEQAFRDLMTDLGLEGSEILFVDDRPTNLAKAAKFGIRIVLCGDPEAAEAEIRGRVSNL